MGGNGNGQNRPRLWPPLLIIAVTWATVVPIVCLPLRLDPCPAGTTRLDRNTCVSQGFVAYIKCLEGLRLDQAKLEAQAKISGKKDDLSAEAAVGDQIEQQFGPLSPEEKRAALKGCTRDLTAKANRKVDSGLVVGTSER